jgi:CheY-like chemotaxis protein
MIRLELADTGPGIPPEMRERVFEPFFTTKPRGVGTGIGLSVSRRIIDAHGGTIGVEGRPAGGAAFIVRLPIGHPSPGPPEAADGAAGSPVRATALVIDDEPDIAEVLAEILRLEGFAVDVADGGRQALERIAARRYDLVISDLRMPDMDGPALFRTLERERPEIARRMLFITGDTLSPDASDFVEGSGVPVIEKPFDARRIRRLAAQQVARDQPGP